MTCRHAPNDPSCSSHPNNKVYAEQASALRKRYSVRKELSDSPDADDYEIEEISRVGPHLVIRAKYPSCVKCAYEGNKVMVFLDVPETAVLKWRRLDPHFRADAPKSAKEAPSPAARFPASSDGWADAIAYANTKLGRKS